jgi:hypothetical protein
MARYSGASAPAAASRYFWWRGVVVIWKVEGNLSRRYRRNERRLRVADAQCSLEIIDLARDKASIPRLDRTIQHRQAQMLDAFTCEHLRHHVRDIGQITRL